MARFFHINNYRCLGVARIFQKGGHTVSNRGYSRFRNLNIVGCLTKKQLTKGGHGHPRTPPPLPSYALALLGRCTLSMGMKLNTCRLENTYKSKKKNEAYTGNFKFKETLAGEDKTWMDFSNVKT